MHWKIVAIGCDNLGKERGRDRIRYRAKECEKNKGSIKVGHDRA